MIRIFAIIICSILYIHPLRSQYEKEINAYREHKKNEFLISERTPLKTKEEVDKMDFYAVNKDYKCKCKFTPQKNAQPFDLPTYSGVTRKYIK
jgi:hypothetical protein